jgi:hypothetical protein
VAVRVDELVGEAPLPAGGPAGRGERPKREVGDREQSAERERAGRERQPHHVVAERDRPVPPQQQVHGLARDEARRIDVRDRGDEPGDEGEGRARAGERARKDAVVGPVVSHVERASSRPEQGGRAEREERLLEIEALEHVEDTECEEQPQRGLPGAVAPAAEVEGAGDQGDAGRHGERVEEGHELDRLDLEEQVTAPGDVRRQRGGEVDHAHGQRRRRGEGGQALEAAAFPERRGNAVDPEPPAGGVAEAGEEVTPVLGDEPSCCGGETDCEAVVAERAEDRGGRGQREAEVVLVDPAAEDVEAWPARMALDTNHPV